MRYNNLRSVTYSTYDSIHLHSSCNGDGYSSTEMGILPTFPLVYVSLFDTNSTPPVAHPSRVVLLQLVRTLQTPPKVSSGGSTTIEVTVGRRSSRETITLTRELEKRKGVSSCPSLSLSNIGLVQLCILEFYS